jgi:hypothetical protein
VRILADAALAAGPRARHAPRVRPFRFALATVTGLVFAACGARSSLPVPPEGPPEGDAGVELPDAGLDAPPDAPPDVTIPSDCADAGVTYVYLVSESNELYAFYPPDLSVMDHGTIGCEDPSVATPYSMAVDRLGFAYVVFTDGNLFEVNLLDASCTPTTFAPDQQGFLQFGMGFSKDADGGVDTLYVTDISEATGPAGQPIPSKGLASIDVQSFTLSPIGPYTNASTPIVAMELTGTGDGRLYGYALNDPGSGGRIIEIDKTSANVISETPLAAGDQDSALAFAFWGGDFYVFTSPGGANGTTITRYRPADGTEVQVGTIDDVVVGAGVSTCAPE